MLKYFVKAFSISKDNNPDTNQDYMSFDINKNRFVVADGVSNSYRPDITSKLLCDYFIKGEYSDEAWAEAFNDSIIQKVSEDWNNCVDGIESSLTGRAKLHAEYLREDFCMGSSTFASIHINPDREILVYNVLGDSSIFIIPDDGPYTIISTCEETIYNGKRKTQYGRFTQCVGSSIPGCKGRPKLELLGEWRSGQEKLSQGYIVLATDAVSSWLQDSLLMDQNPIDTIWRFKDDEEFAAFADVQRNSSYMDDDLTIIVIHVVSDNGSINKSETTIDHDLKGTEYLVPIELYEAAKRIVYGYLFKEGINSDCISGNIKSPNNNTNFFIRVWRGLIKSK